jgi:hypothetical protein
MIASKEALTPCPNVVRLGECGKRGRAEMTCSSALFLKARAPHQDAFTRCGPAKHAFILLCTCFVRVSFQCVLSASIYHAFENRVIVHITKREIS